MSAMKRDGKDIVGLNVGEPDFQPPKPILDAAQVAITSGHTKYTPTSGAFDVRRAIVDHHKRFYDLEYSPDQCLISSGGKQSLYQLFNCLCGPGDEVVIIAPFWPSYKDQVQLAGATPVIVRTTMADEFIVNPQVLDKAITERTRVLVLCNPSNPTGTVYSEEQLVVNYLSHIYH